MGPAHNPKIGSIVSVPTCKKCKRWLITHGSGHCMCCGTKN